MRTVVEGGWSSVLERREYLDYIRSIAAGTQADIIDCEAFNGDEEYEPERISLLCDMVRKEGKYTILSSHAKRRLTHRDYLKAYCDVVRNGGMIEFKTDNDDLFGFTLEEIESLDLQVVEFAVDLHSSEFDSRNYMTEYEAKFMKSVL